MQDLQDALAATQNEEFIRFNFLGGAEEALNRADAAAAERSAAKARADWLTPFDNSRAYWAQYQEAEA